MIVRDEEATLARCLSCVEKFADEIIVVDTGSTDKTVEIAKKFTPHIHFFEWCDDFSLARNYSFSMASCDLVMWLDADDVITEENCLKIAALKDEMSDYDMAFLKYAALSDGDEPLFVYYRERIFKRSLNVTWQGPVHEVVSPFGRIKYSDAVIFHKKVKSNPPLRNLSIYQKQIACGISLDERQKFYYGRELFFNKMYRESIAVLEDFLSGNGWVENKIEACRQLFLAYIAIGENDRALSSLLRAFTFSSPRAQDLCTLGEYSMRRDDYRSAEFWYKAALTTGEKMEDGGFVNVDFLAFIPYLQLCVIYDRQGEYDLAEKYNRLAGQIKPNDERYLYNQNYFNNKHDKGKE